MDQRCKFFNSVKGCRKGDKCPFVHIPKHNKQPSAAADHLPGPQQHDLLFNAHYYPPLPLNHYPISYSHFLYQQPHHPVLNPHAQPYTRTQAPASSSSATKFRPVTSSSPAPATHGAAETSTSTRSSVSDEMHGQTAEEQEDIQHENPHASREVEGEATSYLNSDEDVEHLVSSMYAPYGMYPVMATPCYYPPAYFPGLIDRAFPTSYRTNGLVAYSEAIDTKLDDTERPSDESDASASKTKTKKNNPKLWKSKVIKYKKKEPAPLLPNEMWDKILSHCDDESLTAASSVCTQWRIYSMPLRKHCSVSPASSGELLRKLATVRTMFPKLKSLTVSHCALGDFSSINSSGSNELSSLFPESLEHLSLSDCQGVTNSFLAELAVHISNLKHLDLINCYELTEASISSMPTTLRVLNLHGSHEFHQSTLTAIDRLRNLEVLNLKDLWRIGMCPFMFKNLTQLEHLHTLILARTYALTDADIQVLPNFLRVLDISFCLNVSNMAVQYFLPAALEELYVKGCKVIIANLSDDHVDGSAMVTDNCSRIKLWRNSEWKAPPLPY